MKKLYKYEWQLEDLSGHIKNDTTKANSISDLLTKICKDLDKVNIKNFSVDLLEEINFENLEAKWDIDYDGYYPYCTNCNCEPDRRLVLEQNGPPEYCPNCGAKMTNFKDLQFKG